MISPAGLTWIRLGLALAGFAGALLAIALEERRLAWGAIVLLTGSVIVRLAQRRKRPGDAPPED